MRTLSLLLALAGCLKPTPPPKAVPGTALQIASVLDSFDNPAVAALPEPLDEALRKELAARDIALVAAPESLIATYAERRATEARLASLGADPARPALLVECAPRFSDQVGGRYHWSVEVSLSISGGPARSFSVPVHLLYAHEDEDDAAAAAGPVIARRLGQLLDEWVSSRGAPQ